MRTIIVIAMKTVSFLNQTLQILLKKSSKLKLFHNVTDRGDISPSNFVPLGNGEKWGIFFTPLGKNGEYFFSPNYPQIGLNIGIF